MELTSTSLLLKLVPVKLMLVKLLQQLLPQEITLLTSALPSSTTRMSLKTCSSNQLLLPKKISLSCALQQLQPHPTTVEVVDQATALTTLTPP